MKVKVESEKGGLKLNIQKTKIMASGPITLCQINGETVEAARNFTGAGRGGRDWGWGDTGTPVADSRWCAAGTVATWWSRYPSIKLKKEEALQFLFTFCHRVVSSEYLRLLLFLPATWIPACASSSPAFCMMYSACKLNKQGDNMQPWHTPFPCRLTNRIYCQASWLFPSW